MRTLLKNKILLVVRSNEHFCCNVIFPNLVFDKLTETEMGRNIKCGVTTFIKSQNCFFFFWIKLHDLQLFKEMGEQRKRNFEKI